MNKQELLETLKNQKENLMKSFSVSDEKSDSPSNIQKMYDIFDAMEDKIAGLEEESQELENLSVMYEAVKNYTDRIIVDKTENEPFSFNSYKYADEIQNISEKYGAEFQEILAPIRMVNENKTISFTGENSLENIYENLQNITKYSMMKQSNPIIGGAFTESEVNKISIILNKNWNTYANVSREGALPFIYFSLLADDCTPEQIANCKAPQEKIRDIYKKVLDIENPEKREETLNWCTEKYLKGISIAYSEAEKEMAYSERIKPEKMFGRAGALLQTMLQIGGLNYLQDKKFISQYEKVRDELNIQYHGEKFDVRKAHSANFTLMNSYMQDDMTQAFATAMFSKNQDVSASTFIGLQMQVFARMKSELSTPHSFNRVSELNPESVEGGKTVDEWARKHSDEPGIMSFLAENMRTGKFFSNLTINPQTGSYVMNTDIKELEKDYSEFVLNNSEKIRSDKIMGAVRADKSGIEMSKEELDRVVGLNKEKEELVSELNTLLTDRIALVNRKAKELKKDIEDNGAMKTEATKSILAKMYSSLSKYKSKSDMTNKLEILSKFKDSDLDFSTQGKETSDKEKFDSILNKVINMSEGKEESKSEEGKALSHSDVLEKIQRIEDIEKDTMYKKSREMPKATTTVALIQKMYNEKMKELANLGKLDNAEKPIGNTELFDQMYESMNDIVNYGNAYPSKPGEGLNALMEKANRNIETYIKNRDSIIKWTHKGRERLRICKDFIKTAKILQTQYADLSTELLKEYRTHQRAYAEKTDELINLVKGENSEMEQTKVNDKKLNESMENSADKGMESK